MKVWKQEEWTADGGGERPQQAARCESCGSGADSGLQNVDETKKAREKAVYYLQFSGKTENELRKKLAEQEFSPASIDSAIEFVKKYRYLNDEDYARRFVEKNGQKKSRRQMMYELSAKGIAGEILDRVFDDMQVDEETQILALLEKRKYSGEGASHEEKQKISAYLVRKGFSYDAIHSALIQFARKGADCGQDT